MFCCTLNQNFAWLYLHLQQGFILPVFQIARAKEVTRVVHSMRNSYFQLTGTFAATSGDVLACTGNHRNNKVCKGTYCYGHFLNRVDACKYVLQSASYNEMDRSFIELWSLCIIHFLHLLSTLLLHLSTC